MSNKQPSPIKKVAGFTLIEVMIALLIVATALGAAAKVTITAANNGVGLTNRTAAQWVALNQLAVLKLRRQFPVRAESGKEKMMMRTWVWQQKAEATPDDHVLKVTIDVRLEGADKDDTAASITGFIAKL